MIEIKIDTSKLKPFFDKLTKEEHKNSEQALFKVAGYLQGQVKLSIAGHKGEPTSVDTGRFLNSVSIEMNKFNALVFTEIPYAKFLEYGTSKLEPRRHFTNTAFREKKRINDMVKKIFR